MNATHTAPRTWPAIKGRIAEALTDRLEGIKKAVDDLDAHISQCERCQLSETAYNLCPIGNRLCHAALNL